MVKKNRQIEEADRETYLGCTFCGPPQGCNGGGL